MLLQFRFSNFRSFKNETVLDMRASGSNEYSDHVRQEGVDKVLPVASIYGANASGKSNVFRALSDMLFYVLTSFAFDDQFNTEKNNGVLEMLKARFPLEPHFFQKDKPSTFEVYFTMLYKTRVQYFKYGFSLDSDGICEEWLGKAFKTDIEKNKPYKMLFERQRGEKLFLANSIEKYRENIELSLQKKVLLISLGTKLKIELMMEVFNWFVHFVFLSTKDDIKRFSLNEFEQTMFPNELGKEMFEDGELKKRVLAYIRSFDTSIKDIHVTKDSMAEKSLRIGGVYHIFFIHRDKFGEISEIPIEDESAGTVKMISLYQSLQDSLKQGSVFFADELDIKLHPLLMRNIIINFTDLVRNPKNAQLIFTTHNTIYMDMGLLRRDEIWFTEKNDDVSELYSLDDIQDAGGNKIRKDANYAKNYLLGKYGAIPNLYELMGDPDHE